MVLTYSRFIGCDGASSSRGSASRRRGQWWRGRSSCLSLECFSTAAAARNIEAFRRGMRELGYAEGRSVALEFRYADGHIDRLPDLAADLVTLKPAVIVASSPAAATAARNATGTGSANECDTSYQSGFHTEGSMVFKSPVNDEVEYKLDCEAAARLAAAFLMTTKKGDDQKTDDVRSAAVTYLECLEHIQFLRRHWKKTILATVTGDDQHVGFRAMIMKQAIKYNLAGSAKNEANEIVHFTLQGELGSVGFGALDHSRRNKEIVEYRSQCNSNRSRPRFEHVYDH